MSEVAEALVVSEGVQLALIMAGTGAVTGLVAPFVMSWQNNRHRRAEKIAEAEAKAKEKQEDYARQDMVAERLLKATEASELAAKETKVALKEIHVLVNSNLQAAEQAQLDAMRETLFLKLDAVQAKQAAGVVPSIAELQSIDAMQKRIYLVEQSLRNRLAAHEQLTAEAKAKEAAEKNAPRPAAAAQLQELPSPLPVVVVDPDGTPIKAVGN